MGGGMGDAHFSDGVERRGGTVGGGAHAGALSPPAAC
jgi:hypothetical protein